MIVETHNAMRSPTRVEATQVTIRDRFGQVAAFVLESRPGLIQVVVRGDPQFNDILHDLGLSDSVRVLRPGLPDLTKVR